MQDKLRIFQIGFNKCGTISLYRLFHDYCEPTITSIHWNRGYLARDIHDNILNGREPLLGYDSYSVYLDMECFRTYNEKINWVSIAKDYFDLLDINYPNSKFILNTRNIDSWITSRIRHMCNFSPMRYGFTERLPSKIPYVEYHKQAYGLDNIDDLIKVWKEEWYTHHDNVITHFTYRPNDLLVFDIEKDPFSKIVDFFQPCGLSFQTDRLPYENKTQDCS
jgi:hypothetical protein